MNTVILRYQPFKKQIYLHGMNRLFAKQAGINVMLLTDDDIKCLEQARALIEKNNRLHYSIEEIAHAVGMGRTRLKTCFKAYYGSGLYAYLREQRMQLALQLLQDTAMPIKAVAKAVGYKQTSNFTFAFKKRFGETPGEVRGRSY